MNKYYFISAFCINLKSRKDRLIEFNKEIAPTGMKVQKFTAISIEDMPAKGCTLSHKGVLAKSLLDNLEFVLVLEDDIKIEYPVTFLADLKALLQNLPNDWHILYLGGLVGRNGRVKKINKYCSRVTNFMCTYAMIYNKRSYKILIEAIENPETNKYMNDGWDRWLAQVYQNPYPCYSTNKILISERPSFSNIDKKYKKSALWYKIRFFFYKSNLGFILDTLGYLGDKLSISHRSRNSKIQI